MVVVVVAAVVVVVVVGKEWYPHFLPSGAEMWESQLNKMNNKIILAV